MLLLILWVFHIKNSEFLILFSLHVVYSLQCICIYIFFKYNILPKLLIFWIEISSKPPHTHAPMRHPAIRTHKKEKQRVELGSLKNRSNRDRYFPMALKISPSRKTNDLIFHSLYGFIDSTLMDGIWFAFEIPEGRSFSMTLCLQSKLSKAKIGKSYEIVLTCANNHLRRCSNVTCFPTAVLWHPDFLMNFQVQATNWGREEAHLSMASTLMSPKPNTLAFATQEAELEVFWRYSERKQW